MPYIFITANSNNNLYDSRKFILEESYKPSELFITYIHKALGSTSGDIYVCKNNAMAYRYVNNLHITLNDDYKRAIISRVYVYFNKYEKTTPLILVVIFSGQSSARSRYYPYSKISPLIDGNKLISINELDVYDISKDDEQLLDLLIEENDNLNKFLTYRIDRKINGTYNKGKIKISNSNLRGENGNTVNEFCKYTHTPTDDKALYNSFLLYNKIFLVGNDKRTITTLQNVRYNGVYVYFGSTVNEPLLLELYSTDEENQNKFYYHTRTDEGMLYWVEIQIGKTVLGINFEKGPTIQKQLTDKGNKKLLYLLKKLKENLFKTLYVMIDKQIKYSVKDVIKLFNDSKNYRLVNTETNPLDKTNETQNKCLKNNGYKIYEHNFASILSDIQKEELVQLKFILPSSYGSNRYSEIVLFDTNTIRSNSIYKKGDENKFYVYFYGNDTRPLLLSFNGKTYKPRNKVSYFSGWVRIENIEICSVSEDNSEFLKILSEIIGYLNIVNLCEVPKIIKGENQEPNFSGPEQITYDVQSYNSQAIQVKITYEDKTCYRVYTHTPNGTGDNGNGFRLGDIKYKDSALTYDLTKQLLKLSAYYNLYDSNHEFPLLVILEFKGTKDKDYYKLVSNLDAKERTWTKFQGDEEERYLKKVKELETEIENLEYEIKNLGDAIQNIETQIEKSENDIKRLKEKLEKSKGEESTTVNPEIPSQKDKREAQNGEQSENPEKTEEEKLKDEEENVKKLKHDKENMMLDKSDKEKKLEVKREDLRNLLEQKAYWIMRSLGIRFSKESPLFNPDMCKENNTSNGTIVGTMTSLGLIFGGLGGVIYRYPEAFVYNISKFIRWIQRII